MASDLHKKYVKGTPKKAIVQSTTVLLGNFTIAVVKGVPIPCGKVYLSTRVIKHVYDKRPAEEFDSCVEALFPVVKYPDKVYKNKNGKRGAYCFVKKISNLTYLVSVETIHDESGNPTHCEVATFFRPSEDYLKGFELCWEWKGGTPSS